MNRERRYVINKTEAESYSPPRHVGTINYRLSGKGGLPSQNLDVLIGELKKGSEAQNHYHKKSEQVIFVLEGACNVEFQDGTKEQAEKDDLIYFPIRMGHRIVVSSNEFKALVIYSPPLDDDDMIALPDTQ
jgi:quercetin dioxygenase-like cupin family protein